MAYHAIQPVPITPWQRWAFAAALVALAVAASWNGVFNQFTYDDVFIVENNKLLRDLGNWWRHFNEPYWPLHWGADGYRPLTILAFSVEWAVGAGKPWVFHAVSIGLYAAVSVAVFYLAETCLPFAAAWVAAALFAVHPLHVEAVANVVGQSELLVALFMIPAVTIYIRGRNANDFGLGRKLAIAALYALACLSKEHGIVLPAVLLAAELIVVIDKAPIRERFVKLRPFVLSLVMVAVAYLGAHSHISSEVLTGFHQYVPFSSMGVDRAGRIWTMFGLVPEWIRLFLWPARLSPEYGPPAFPVVTEFQPYQIPGMLILASVVGLVIVGRRKAPAVAFGIALMVITLLPTSNFIVASGILLAERTLFLPSLGAMIAVAAVVPWLYRRARLRPMQIAAVAALPILLVLGGWRSMQRTKVWKDNDSLFEQSVLDAPFVYRTHFMLGAWKFHLKRKVEGEREYRLAMGMYDMDPYVYYSLGLEYLNARMYRPAASHFRKVLEIDSTIIEARVRLAMTLAQLDRWPEAREQALKTLSQDTRSVRTMRLILKLAAEAEMNPGKPGPGVSLPDSGAATQPDSGKVPAPVQKAAPLAGVTRPGKSQPPT